MASLFVPIKVKANIQLNARDIDEDIDGTILQKFKSVYEGKCTRFGYIRPNSLQVVNRTDGRLEKIGKRVHYYVTCLAEACDDIKGMVVEAKVLSTNMAVVLAETSIPGGGGDSVIPLLDILIPKRSVGIQSEIDLSQVQVGQTVLVEVMGKRYQFEDTRISIIGRAVDMSHKVGERIRRTAADAMDDANMSREAAEGNEDEDRYSEQVIDDENGDEDGSEGSASSDMEDEDNGATKKTVLVGDEDDDDNERAPDMEDLSDLDDDEEEDLDDDVPDLEDIIEDDEDGY
jgi:hypothetical protein